MVKYIKIPKVQPNWGSKVTPKFTYDNMYLMQRTVMQITAIQHKGQTKQSESVGGEPCSVTSVKW